MNANPENKQSADPNRASLRFKKLAVKKAYESLAKDSGGDFSFNQLMEMAAELAYAEVARRVDTFKKGFSLGRNV